MRTLIKKQNQVYGGTVSITNKWTKHYVVKIEEIFSNSPNMRTLCRMIFILVSDKVEVFSQTDISLNGYLLLPELFLFQFR